MIVWAGVCGAVAGWVLAEFDQIGLLLGALFGALAGLGLRTAVRKEIARAIEAANTPVAARYLPPTTIAAPAPPPEPVEDVAREPEPAPESRPAILAPWAARVPDEPAEPTKPNFVETAVAAARDWLLGGNTIVRAGLVILFIGLAFLARFAAQHALFPIELRLAIIMVVGMALLGVGFSRRHIRPTFALALQGTGVAAIYLTIFAATRLFDVLPPLPAFGLMIVVCALACALALLQNAQGLAVAAFLGGFAVPVLLSTGEGSSVVLFGYYTILNLAVLFIAQRRAWRLVNLVGFFATFGVATAWGILRYDPDQYATSQAFLITFVLIYIAAAMLYSRRAEGPLGSVVDSTLLFGPALAGFGLQVGLVRHIEFGSAFSALGFGAVYLGLAVFARRRGYAQNVLLRDSLIAIGVGFATLAIPLALGARWTSSAWALEGAAAFWVGMRQARWLPRAFGLALQAVAALVFVSTLDGTIGALPIFNATFLAAMLIALPLLATAWWLRRALPKGEGRFARSWAEVEDHLGAPVFVAGFAFWWLAWALEAVRTLPPVVAGEGPLPVFGPAIQPLLVMLAYVASAGIAAVAGRRLDWRVATWPARVTLVPIVVTLIGQIVAGRHVLLSPDFALWGAAIGVHVALLRAADRAGDTPPAWQRAAHVGTVWLLTLGLADCLWLGIDRAALWGTSWAGVVFLLSATLVLLALTATRGRAAWPFGAHATAYFWVAAAPLAALVFLGVLTAALSDPGRAAPLPYLPLLNPLELTLALGLAALWLWRRALVAAQPTGAGAITAPTALAPLALLAFVVVNTVWLRIAHHYLGVDWTADAMIDSFTVQTGLAILWTLLALGLMLVAHRRMERRLWLVGAALLALVVVKLLLIDLANAGGGERVVTFMAVGLLMLVMGYFAPLPPARDEGAPA
ncbi:DUF2339 domain-containing protein [Glacieibacterium frigidum]|uniref:DUF2339 domain-containing protein n=1 Tax=Glacieibacterium frigidum TaxID=2593303 RepID=A0A552UA02_9SPHN|nr:DUF2339 domain-containing protein [Glacieibacterium frigidum]TRW15019.1 DUF2339 domain-containing protein [Glacieibacterium frigidum]